MMAALYLLTIPGPAAWAQTARMANAPVAPLSPVIAISAFSAPVGAPSLLGAPALTATGLQAPSALRLLLEGLGRSGSAAGSAPAAVSQPGSAPPLRV